MALENAQNSSNYVCQRRHSKLFITTQTSPWTLLKFEKTIAIKTRTHFYTIVAKQYTTAVLCNIR